MRQRVSRLLYWCFMFVGLTGVFVVLRGSLRPTTASLTLITYGDTNNNNEENNSSIRISQNHNVRNHRAQFVIPVEKSGNEQDWRKNQNFKHLAEHQLDQGTVNDEVTPLIQGLPRNRQRLQLQQSHLQVSKTDIMNMRNVQNNSIKKEEIGSLSPVQKTTSNAASSEVLPTHYSYDNANLFLENEDLPENITVIKQHEKLKLEDIFIGVKTTAHFHRSRLDIVVNTWFQQAKKQTYFFTDANDPEWQAKTGGHMVNTGCPTDHHRLSLCCKFATMYLAYMESSKKWLCHFDDDNYLNVPNLVSILSGYASDKDYYIGRSSLNHPIETFDKEDDSKNVRFWFATGGAGFCISRALALNIFPYAGGGVFKTMCNRIRLPDDVTVGFISEHLEGTKLSNNRLFNSHLQSLRMFTGEELKKQVTLSYGLSDQRRNVVEVPGAIFSTERDPSRLLSLHCYLYPGAELCKRAL